MNSDAKRNYAAHVLDGGLYMGSMAFLNASTVLPTAIAAFGGAAWLVSLMPIMMSAGILLPPLLIAHRIDRLQRFKPLLLLTGCLQRVPTLAGGLILIAWPGAPSWLLTAAVAATPLLGGLACGVGFVAWQQLLVKTVRPNRRSSVFALRYVVGSAIGLAAGLVVRATLAAHPGARGYGLLHLYSFGILVLSYLLFATIRERPSRSPASGRHRTLMANLHALPQVFRTCPPLRLYLVANLLFSGIFIVAPFLAIHLRRILGQPESFVGTLVSAQMLGAVCGSLGAGWLGDRFGGRAPMLVGQALTLVVAAGSLCPVTPASGVGLFFLFGIAFNARQIGGHTMTLDIVPEERRGTALAVVSLAQLASLLLASGVSTWAWNSDGHYRTVAFAGAAFAVAALVCLVFVHEPRGRTQA